MIKRRLLLLMLMVVSMTISFAQSNQASGTVFDSQGNPVIGASIKVVGGKTGVVTDMDGKFSLKGIKSGQKLEISYVGMKPQTVSAKQGMKITLDDDNSMLDEVVVTAFGTEKRSAFTGSATVIDAKAIEKTQATNVMSALLGNVTGLEIAPTSAPGSTADITIRGAGSINASTAPLIVLDGMPYDGDWNAINPSDVEKITVLKDAASNALYGSRGANGVIIITTKKGKSGKTSVSLDIKNGFSTRGVPDYDKITDPATYYETYYKALYNYQLNQGQTSWAAHQLANQYLTGDKSNGGLGYNIYTVPTGQSLIGTNGKLNPNATLGSTFTKNGQTYTLYPDDWTDAAYRTGYRQEYNVSASGGSDKATVYASFGYLNDKGIVTGSQFERFTGKLSATMQIKPWLNVGANANYAHSVTHSQYESGSSSGYAGNSVYSYVSNIAPIYPLYVRDGNGNVMSDANGTLYDWGDGTYNAGGVTRSYLQNTNAVQSATLDYSIKKSNTFGMDGFVDVSFLKDFKFTAKAGVNVWESRYQYGYNPFYGSSVSSNGSLYVYHYRTTSLNLQQLLNYSKSLGKHNINGLIGHESYNRVDESLSGNKTGAADYYNNKELDGYVTDGSPGSDSEKYMKEGWFARAQYNYDEKYFASASYRLDASNVFAEGHRWGSFFSFGGAYLMSKETWFKNDVLTMFKVKASYGEQGNDQIAASNAIGTYFYNTDVYKIGSNNGDISLSFYRKGNEDITWEKAKNFNTGFEFELFGGRINGDIEYYHRLTSDMLMRFSVPASLGYTYYYQNVGDLVNQGVEMTIGGYPVKTKNFSWNISINATFNNNEVTYLNEKNKTITVDGHGGYQSGNYGFVGEGMPLGTYYMPEYVGVNSEGQSLWSKTLADGTVTTTTDYSSATKHLYDMERKVYGSINNTFKYKNFDLSLQFTYGIGGKGYDYEYAQLMMPPSTNSAGYALSVDVLDAWSPENTTSNIPRFVYGDLYTAGGNCSSRFLIDNSYLAFQNFQIGYTFPMKTISHIGLSKLRVYITGDNIYLWSHRKGYDPRVSQGYGICSPMRTISAGVNVTF